MIPLIGTLKEFIYVREKIKQVFSDLEESKGISLPIPIGTMIELPGAALRADELAKEAEFFSFGSNDLTQTTLGISRDDGNRFLSAYMESGILDADPFVQLEEKSVGWLIQNAIHLARKTNPQIPIGLCGEHGANPTSIRYLVDVGVNSLSCSPYRVPVAKLATAQKFILQKRNQK